MRSFASWYWISGCCTSGLLDLLHRTSAGGAHTVVAPTHPAIGRHDGSFVARYLKVIDVGGRLPYGRASRRLVTRASAMVRG
jgi:hypothetical protein